MRQSNHPITSFPADRFAFFNQELCDYSFVLLGQVISASEVANALDSFYKHRDVQEVTQFFEDSGIYSLGLLRSKHVDDFEDECCLLDQKIDLHEPHFIVLLEYRSPDIICKPSDISAEECFLISPGEFARSCKETISTGLAYHLILEAVSDEGAIEQIAVHQIAHPNPCLPSAETKVESTEVVIPHRGSLKDLKAALWYLTKQKSPPRKVSVCFDEEVTDEHLALINSYDEANFFVNLPGGVGPYPSRDVLARSTEEDIITFHDSDDCSTIDRIGVLAAKLKEEQLDVVGSHELRINKIEQRLEAIRFPLDVIESNKRNSRYGIFFPTTAIKKSAYFKVGGLSTIRRHSSDTQFYLKSYFFLNMENVDEFLYIRTKRPNSLTTAPDTALGTIVRKRLHKQWRSDFLRMKHLNADLALSTLIDEKNVVNIEVVPLKGENIDLILSWQKFQQQIREKSITQPTKGTALLDGENILKDRLLSFKIAKVMHADGFKPTPTWLISWSVSVVVLAFISRMPGIKRYLKVLLSYFWKY